LLTDSDGDLIPDGLEDLNHDGDYDAPAETNLCSDQTDGDGIADGVEDANHNGVKDPTETDPRLTDTDGDLIGDGIEVPGCSDPLLTDSDYDGLDDGIEDVNLNGYQDGLETNLCNANSDSDLWNFQDGWEVLYGFDPLDPDDPDGTLDLDSDGLTNNEEALNNTNPFNPDTDGDAMPDGWEVDNLLAPTDPADAYDDLEPDGRRNLDEYKRGFNPRLAEPCGNDKYGRWCFGESNGNGIWDSPDLIALKQLAVGAGGNYPYTLPHSGDALDLNGNSVFDAPDIISMKQLMVGAYSGYLSDGDTLHLESEAALDMEVGDWEEISVSLRSTWDVTRGGVGVVFYFDSGSDKGELWGGDGSAVPEGSSPPESFPSGSRYCVTDDMDSGGQATIWFKATGAGSAVIKAAVPASSLRLSNALGPNASVSINITSP